MNKAQADALAALFRGIAIHIGGVGAVCVCIGMMLFAPAVGWRWSAVSIAFFVVAFLVIALGVAMVLKAATVFARAFDQESNSTPAKSEEKR